MIRRIIIILQIQFLIYFTYNRYSIILQLYTLSIGNKYIK